ncbi:MAG: SagB/ThcOx family dehydrogenase [Acidobacteria bacterium]|nr:SagB/ThcOx family dehydrogenase [Acidobacteriota bacterium]
MRTTCSLALAVVAGLAACRAQDLKPIALPKPQTEGGKPLMQVLKERKSSREFSREKLSPEVLSNLLWAALGTNRADGKRTTPSAMNRQGIEIYVTLPDGVYLFEAGPHRLSPVVAGDLRARTGTQAFVADAALNLIYVADYAKMGNLKPEDKAAYASAEAGFIGENVYLFCASEGLGTVFRALIDRDALAKALNLRPDQRITYSQSVGYPKK